MRRLVCCLLIVAASGCLVNTPSSTPKKPLPAVTPPAQVPPLPGPPDDGTAPKKTAAQSGIGQIIERPQVMQELQQLGVLYTAWSLTEPRGNADAFKKSLQSSARSIYTSIADGYYTINPKLTARSATVIAYETQPVASRGHYVVRRGGAVVGMTSQELAAELAK